MNCPSVSCLVRAHAHLVQNTKTSVVKTMRLYSKTSLTNVCDRLVQHPLAYTQSYTRSRVSRFNTDPNN